MIRFLVILAVLFGIALGFHRLKATSGEIVLTVGDTAYAVELTTAVIGLIVALIVAVLLVLLVRAILKAPRRITRHGRRRNAERAQLAVSQGLLAIAAGDIRTADRAAIEASRRAPGLPLTRLLEAQAAQLRGDRTRALHVFQEMTEAAPTRIAGLRGLYIEAEREGEQEAARQIAETARHEAPSAAWAARALLRHQAAAADWEGALRTLTGAVDGKILDKRTARRQRAVVLTAKALAEEEGNPDAARKAAIEAHDLAPELAPASVVASRLLSRQGDVRRATRVLEDTWRVAPHPEVADAYVHVRSGDSAGDRLKRAETLFRMRQQADDGRLAVARAAIDARDFARARDVLTPVLTTRPTRNALIVMAELVQAETDDRGQAREWLARAVNAPRDPVWTADGMILEAWAPASPVTGRIDTVEWKVPVEELEVPHLAIDAADLRPVKMISVAPPAEEPTPIPAMHIEPPAPPAAPSPPEAVSQAPPPRRNRPSWRTSRPLLLRPRSPSSRRPRTAPPRRMSRIPCTPIPCCRVRPTIPASPTRSRRRARAASASSDPARISALRETASVVSSAHDRQARVPACAWRAKNISGAPPRPAACRSRRSRPASSSSRRCSACCSCSAARASSRSRRKASACSTGRAASSATAAP